MASVTEDFLTNASDSYWRLSESVGFFLLRILWKRAEITPNSCLHNKGPASRQDSAHNSLYIFLLCCRKSVHKLHGRSCASIRPRVVQRGRETTVCTQENKFTAPRSTRNRSQALKFTRTFKKQEYDGGFPNVNNIPLTGHHRQSHRTALTTH